ISSRSRLAAWTIPASSSRKGISGSNRPSPGTTSIRRSLAGRRTQAEMCGRVRLPEDYSEIKIDLKLHEVVPHTYVPRWNVPPTESLPVITSKDGHRRLEPMRWGLIPSWAKDAKVGFSTFNARADGASCTACTAAELGEVQ